MSWNPEQKERKDRDMSLHEGGSSEYFKIYLFSQESESKFEAIWRIQMSNKFSTGPWHMSGIWRWAFCPHDICINCYEWSWAISFSFQKPYWIPNRPTYQHTIKCDCIAQRFSPRRSRFESWQCLFSWQGQEGRTHKILCNRIMSGWAEILKKQC